MAVSVGQSGSALAGAAMVVLANKRTLGFHHHFTMAREAYQQRIPRTPNQRAC